jgi:hypothetical protein
LSLLVVGRRMISLRPLVAGIRIARIVCSGRRRSLLLIVGSWGNRTLMRLVVGVRMAR